MRRDELWTSRVGGYIEPIGPNGFDILIKGTDRYINFNTLSGSTGYGFRDNNGVMQWKNSSGSWADITAGGGVTDHSALTNLNWSTAGHIMDADLEFEKTANRAIRIKAVTTPSTIGKTLSIYGGDGNGNTGGDLNLIGGLGAGISYSTKGGVAKLQGGSGNYSSSGGDAKVYGGNDGGGEDTSGGNVFIKAGIGGSTNRVGKVYLENRAGTFKYHLDPELITADRVVTLQNASGTLAYLTDIPSTAGFFALDQTTPQTITNGIPIFGAGLQVGTNTTGANETINATLGNELAPALTGNSGDAGGWTLSDTTGYVQPFAGSIAKTGNGTGTITTQAATTIVAGVTYKVVITVASISGSTATWTIGGNAETSILSAATTYTEYMTAASTGKFIITPTATALRINISSISIKALTNDTGDLTVEGNLKIASSIQQIGGVPAIFMSKAGNVSIGAVPPFSSAYRFSVTGTSGFFGPLVMGGGQAISLFGNLTTNYQAGIAFNSLTTATAGTNNLSSFGVSQSTVAWETTALASKGQTMAARVVGINGSPTTARYDITNVNIDGSANTNVLASFLSNGNVGIGVLAPTAVLNLKAGTTNIAPLKLTTGTNLGTTQGGAIEYDGTHLYFTATDAGTRYQLDQQGGGSGDVVGPAGAIDSNIAVFDTTTGKLIKDSGIGTAVNTIYLGLEADTGYIKGIDATTVDTAGGGLLLQAGIGNGTGIGGNYEMYAGMGGTTGDGGTFTMGSGNGGGTSGNGGDFQITSGSATLGNGGNINFIAGGTAGGGVAGTYKFYSPVGTVNAFLDTSLLTTTDKTFSLPDKDGTFAMLSDIGGGNIIDNEIPVGTIDGTNDTFTLSHTPTAGVEHLYLNGARQTPTLDYTIVADTITFNVPPTVLSKIICDYRYI